MSSKNTATATTRAVLHPRRARQVPSARIVSSIATASTRASEPTPSSSTCAPPPPSNRTLLVFRSLNLPKYNRITVKELEGAILGFVNSKLPAPAPTSATSKRASSSSSGGGATSASSSSTSLYTARSYILTGNVVLTPPPPSPTSISPPLNLPSLIPELETYLLSGHTTNPLVTTIFLRTPPSLQFLVDHCPFDLTSEGRKGSKVHVIFLGRRPERGRVEELRRWVEARVGFGEGERVWWSGEGEGGVGKRKGEGEKKGGKGGEGEGVEVGEEEEGGKEVVLWFPEGHLKSKTTLGAVERILGMKGGMRGWTVLTGSMKLM